MKRKHKYPFVNTMLNQKVSKSMFIFLLIFGLNASNIVFSQEILPAESVEISADRAVYISGEKVLFSGLVNSQDTDMILSTVVYVELITPNGQKIKQSKFWLNNQHFSGELIIPEDVLSGYYFLRAYTKWMRNGNTEDYAYLRLKLINPNSDELLAIADSLIYDTQEAENKFAKPLLLLDKNSYQAGDRITLGWEQENLKGLNNASISMVPEISRAIPSTSFKSKTDSYFQLNFYPETRGISISGTIQSKQEQTPLSFHLVNLHILGESDFIAVLSDSAGHFHMALPERYGNHELFLIAASMENDQVEIQIDQDFCTQNIQLKVPKFSIDEEEKIPLLKMAQNQQLYQAYHQEEDSILEKKMDLEAFYGDAFKTIDFSFYVPLDSLHQYFTDLPSWVVVKKRKGKRQLSLLGPQGELKLYDPLIMVDWVAVDDIERIMAIDHNVVEKIDIINQTYLHGDIIYGGLINILTKHRDFGGLKFPESGMYLNYGFFSKEQPKAETNKLFKNTYEWLTNVSFDSKESMELIAPQTKGKYVVVLQAVDSQGNLVYSYVPFLVE